MRLLAIRGRTRAELALRLEGRGFPRPIVEGALAELERYGYVDDARFAADWVRQQARGSPRGRLALVAGLLARGVERELVEKTVEACLSAEEELTLARRAAERYLERAHRRPRDLLAARLGAHLARRGFPSETIRKVLREKVGDPDV